MKGRKIAATLCTIVMLVCVVLAAGEAGRNNFRNLKVLPNDISDRMLDSIMGSYNKALNVNCDFCHAKRQALFPDPGNQNELDFASDANGMKEQARRMMRLNIDINKNYFYYDSTKRPEFLTVITCRTCHQGHVFPPEE